MSSLPLLLRDPAPLRLRDDLLIPTIDFELVLFEYTN